MAWERRVAQEVAAALWPRLAGPAGPATLDPAGLPPSVHQAYLESLYLLSRPGPEAAAQARDRLEAVVAQSPAFAPAFVALAQAHQRRWASGTEVLPAAEAAVERALELDPTLAEAHLEAGSLAFRLGFNRPAAEAELERALRLNPALARAHHEQACLLAAQGRFDQAVAAAERARELDPRSLWVASDLGFFHYLARRFPQALAASEQALALDPGFQWAHHFRMLSALGLGDEATALAAARAELASRGEPTDGVGSMAAYWQRELERLEAQRDRLPTPAALLARPALALGQRERALALLEEAMASRTGWYLPYLAVDPFFDPLRHEPRFLRLLELVGGQAAEP
jgi:tetratricopeptide (TPR) repeat protein